MGTQASRPLSICEPALSTAKGRVARLPVVQQLALHGAQVVLVVIRRVALVAQLPASMVMVEPFRPSTTANVTMTARTSLSSLPLRRSPQCTVRQFAAGEFNRVIGDLDSLVCPRWHVQCHLQRAGGGGTKDLHSCAPRKDGGIGAVSDASNGVDAAGDGRQLQRQRSRVTPSDQPILSPRANAGLRAHDRPVRTAGVQGEQTRCLCSLLMLKCSASTRALSPRCCGHRLPTLPWPHGMTSDGDYDRIRTHVWYAAMGPGML